MNSASIILLVLVGLIAGGLGSWFLYPVINPAPIVAPKVVHDTLSLGWKHDTLPAPPTTHDLIYIHDTVPGSPPIQIPHYTMNATYPSMLYFSLSSDTLVVDDSAKTLVHAHAEFYGPPVNQFRNYSFFIEPVDLQFPQRVQTVTPVPRGGFLRDLWGIFSAGAGHSPAASFQAGIGHWGGMGLWQFQETPTWMVSYNLTPPH